MKFISMVPNKFDETGISGYLLEFKRDSNQPMPSNWTEKFDIDSQDFVVLGTHEELCCSYATVMKIDYNELIVTLLVEG